MESNPEALALAKKCAPINFLVSEDPQNLTDEMEREFDTAWDAGVKLIGINEFYKLVDAETRALKQAPNACHLPAAGLILLGMILFCAIAFRPGPRPPWRW